MWDMGILTSAFIARPNVYPTNQIFALISLYVLLKQAHKLHFWKKSLMAVSLRHILCSKVRENHRKYLWGYSWEGKSWNATKMTMKPQSYAFLFQQVKGSKKEKKEVVKASHTTFWLWMQPIPSVLSISWLKHKEEVRVVRARVKVPRLLGCGPNSCPAGWSIFSFSV